MRIRIRFYFTQKDLKTFSKDLTREAADKDSLWKQMADSSTIPMEFLEKLLKSKLTTNSELSNLLLMLMEKNGISGSELFSRLVDFSHEEVIHTKTEASDLTIQQAWELFAGEKDDQQASETLQLTSTTDDLDFFHQSLLVSSSGRLRDYLIDLKLESNSINTSIDLAEFLFRNTSDSTYALEELIRALQMVSVNKDYYLNKFNELLTANATGSLKSQLLLSASEQESLNTFEGIMNYLLNQAKYKNYSRESVYDLILSLIGIDDVEKFASKIKEYGYNSINQAIADTSLKYFSNPFELIQYLLMAAQTYDFTQSDINNLLIRMILERGLDNERISAADEAGKKFWKSKKFISTTILVNIVLIILIILFALRKKKR